MGWLLDNMRALDQFETSQATRDRQAKEDAYQEEVRARERKKAADAETALNNLRQDTASLLDHVNGSSVDARKLFNLSPATEQSIAQSTSIDPNWQGTRSQRDVRPTPEMPEPQTKKEQAPTVSPQTVADNYMNLLRANMRYASGIGDVKGFQSAAEMFQKAKLQKDSADVANFVQNASDDELTQIAQQVTNDKSNLYEAAYDPQTKFTTIKLGDAKATLSKAQLGQFAAAKYRLTQGDISALSDMSSISEGLSKKVADSLGIAKTLGDNANDVAYKRGMLDNTAEKNAITANAAQQRLALQQELGIARLSAAQKPSNGYTQDDLNKASTETVRIAMELSGPSKDDMGLDRDKKLQAGQGLATTATQYLQMNASLGQPIQPIVAVQAAALASTPGNIVTMKTQDGAAFPAVKVGSQYIIVGPKLIPANAKPNPGQR